MATTIKLKYMIQVNSCKKESFDMNLKYFSIENEKTCKLFEKACMSFYTIAYGS